jgi:hypothetical protein
MSFDIVHLLWAVTIGGLSAVSLPLGSAVGLAIRPRTSLTAVFQAFGAGALLAALAVALVAPTVLALTEGAVHGGGHGPGLHAAPVEAFLALIAGCVVGGLLFVVLDGLVSARGGFLRKKATAISWFSTRRRKRLEQLLEDVSRINILRHVPPEQTRRLVEGLRPMVLEDGETLFHEGELGDCLYFIRRGEVSLYQGGRFFKNLKAGDVLGELAL